MRMQLVDLFRLVVVFFAAGLAQGDVDTFTQQALPDEQAPTKMRSEVGQRHSAEMQFNGRVDFGPRGHAQPSDPIQHRGHSQPSEPIDLHGDGSGLMRKAAMRNQDESHAKQAHASDNGEDGSLASSDDARKKWYTTDQQYPWGPPWGEQKRTWGPPFAGKTTNYEAPGKKCGDVARPPANHTRVQMQTVKLVEKDSECHCDYAKQKLLVLARSAAQRGHLDASAVESLQKSLEEHAKTGQGGIKLLQQVELFVGSIDLVDSKEHGEMFEQTDADHLVQCILGKGGVRLEENPTMFQGDMQPSSPEALSLMEDAASGGSRWAGPLWTTDLASSGIPYCFDTTADGATQKAFVEATNQITEQVPCVKFKKIDLVDSEKCASVPSIIVQGGNIGCWAYVGMVSDGAGLEGKSQGMGIGTGCAFVGIILHEIGHALGMAHEQARGDRNQYVKTHQENVKPEVFDANFKIVEGSFAKTSYDVLSLMHYGAWEFSSNGGETLTTVIPALQQYIGQREGFSELDINQIGEMYGCLGQCKPIVKNAQLADQLVKGNVPSFTGKCEDQDPTGLTTATGPAKCDDVKSMCAQQEMVKEACPVTCKVCDPATHKYVPPKKEKKKKAAANGSWALQVLPLVVIFQGLFGHGF